MTSKFKTTLASGMIAALYFSVPITDAFAKGLTDAEKIVASYILTSDDLSTISSVPGDDLTHLLYAFAVPCGDHIKESPQTQKKFNAICETKPPFAVFFPEGQQQINEIEALSLLKQEHPHLKILLSIGGWSHSGPFHDMAKSKSGIEHFSKSAVNMMELYPVFDGIDIDWEYPGGGDNTHELMDDEGIRKERNAYTALMKNLRKKLNILQSETGRKYSLSTALPSSPNSQNRVDWQSAMPQMDYLFLMSYDYAVNKAGHQANLHASEATDGHGTDRTVASLLNIGVPANKIILGVPFYGRAWESVKITKDGEITSNETSKPMDISLGYRDLINNKVINESYTRHYDMDIGTVILANSDEQKVISYDDEKTIKMKAKWAKEQGLGGIFSWQIGHDSANNTLTEAMGTINE